MNSVTNRPSQPRDVGPAHGFPPTPPRGQRPSLKGRITQWRSPATCARWSPAASDVDEPARARAPGQPARRLTAPQGAQGVGARLRPPGGHAARLPGRPTGGRGVARVLRLVLGPGTRELSHGRPRRTAKGGAMTVAEETVVRHTITVDAPQEKAFAVFTDGHDRWWPRSHKIGPQRSSRPLGGREGGRWFERDIDGSECDWARCSSGSPRHGSCSRGRSPASGPTTPTS